MEIKILVDRYNNYDALNEIKAEWLFDLLVYADIDEDVLSEYDASELSDFFFEKKIDIIEYPSLGALSVEKNGELIGEWGGPVFKMLKDKESGELYYEVTIENWSIMDE